MIMENKDKKAPKCSIIIIGILFISLVMNMLLSINNYKYKYMAGKDAYNNTLRVRLLNDKNNEILKNAIAQGSISNIDFLNLDKNYSNISDEMKNLWVEFGYYNQDKSFFQSVKKINSENIVNNEIHGMIEEYLNSILEKEMAIQSVKVTIDGEYLEKFQVMKDLSDSIKNYYTKFDEENLSGLEYDDKTNKIIKEHYWIDNLEGLNEINLQFINTDFILKK